MTVRRRDAPPKPTTLVDLGHDVCVTILRLVKEGWQVACDHGWVTADMQEVPMTERLRDAMREVVRDRARWKLAVRAGTETRSSPSVLNPAGRTDISVFLLSLFEKYDEHDHHAIIECKRVAGSNSSLCRLFVVEGVDRFVAGKYSSRHATGFMVGYVLHGSINAACSGINRQLRNKGRSSEQLAGCDVLSDPWTRSSCHPRLQNSDIDLHHAFLDFESP